MVWTFTLKFTQFTISTHCRHIGSTTTKESSRESLWNLTNTLDQLSILQVILSRNIKLDPERKKKKTKTNCPTSELFPKKRLKSWDTSYGEILCRVAPERLPYHACPLICWCAIKATFPAVFIDSKCANIKCHVLFYYHFKNKNFYTTKWWPGLIIAVRLLAF